MDRCEGVVDDNKQPEEAVPELPLKTYQWEDVRRSRSRGGYPWTHLYKEIFDETLVDPENFTMDALRKNKTSTTSSASDSLDIKEITEDDVKGLENIDSSYVVIESPILLGGQIEDAIKDHEGVIESADSSDNISQYLDKDERGPEQLESTETLTLPGPSTPEVQEHTTTSERAKSEEPKRKRKLSVDSNYSRISLSRLGFMKRLREAKDKIKLPKLGKNEPEVIKTEVKLPKQLKVEKNVKPVYIYIPLKPPQGETDEFSYLEFEEKRVEAPATPQLPDVQIEEIEDDQDKEEEEEPSTNTLGLDVPNDQEDDVSAIIFLEGDEENDNKGEYDIMVVDIDEKSQEMTMSQVTNTEVKRQVLESIKRVESQEFKPDQDSGSNLSRTSSRTSKGSVRKRRAKSVEPEPKRRSSIDSSKSLSKIGLLKKLKGFHLPFTKTQSKKSITETQVATPPEPTVTKRPKNKEPVYIHIPLKPADGVTDEFSHLEFETPNEPQPKPEPQPVEPNEEKLPETPTTPPNAQAPQLIFLTPPSDDETLDRPDIPETPSSETGSLFQFGELKQIAKSAIEQVHGALDAVDEELAENVEKIDDKILIDEEDGLKSTQKSGDDATPALKSNLKGGASPLPKKKVSFKRRKSSQAKDDGYEEIVAPSDVKTEEILEKSEKIDTSHEEERNRWSKLSDHEYEPVNPPPDEKPENPPPKSHVSEVLASSSGVVQGVNGDDVTNISVQEMQTEIENRFFNPKTTSSTTVTITEEIRNVPRKSKSRSRSREKEPTKPQNKFQTAIKESATKFKTKLQSIKKPNIALPARPKFQKPNINIKKPNITLPKLPDITSTFRRSKGDEKGQETRSESEVPKQGQGIFDFSTYPRLFNKKKKRDFDSGSLKEKPQKKREVTIGTHRLETSKTGPTQSIRIPLHSDASMDQENGTTSEPGPQTVEIDVTSTSPPQYHEDIEVDDHDAKQRERQEKHRAAIETFTQQLEDTKWENQENHHYDLGEGREDLEVYEQEDVQVTDLDQPEPVAPSAPTRHKAKLQQNDSIDTNHSRDVGSSVSSLGHRIGVLEEIDSDQFFLREKGISQDNIDMGRYLSTEIREAFRTPKNALGDYNYEEMRTSNQSLPDTKKKQIKKPKRRKTPQASQERLRYDQESENEDYNFMPPIRPRRRSKRRKKPEEPEPEVVPYTETIAIYKTDHDEYLGEPDDELPRFYENHNDEPQQYKNVLHVHDVIQRRASEPIPAAPPRKHKSLKSLNASEHDSMFEDYERDINGYQNEQEVVPQKPTKPPRSRSKTRSISQCESIFDRTDSIMYDDDENMVPVVEEPCIKDLRDAMGYAIVDKNQNKNWEHKFCTVPKSQGGSRPPERPLRNYSTLGPSRPPRKISKNMTDEEKENVDITQYIEIEDQKDLQSGEVIQKMQNRPLPAPPRPPRSRSKPLGDITTRSNSELGIDELEAQIELKQETTDETEVSTQTEPLPADFVCEEVPQEETDKIMTPSSMRKQKPEDEVKIEKVLITPTHYTYEETITHGQLLVEPLNGAKILPETTTPRERIISITTDEEETSEIPESFHQLSDPPPELPQQPQKPPRSRTGSMDVLKTQKIQVSDLDVDRLTVNELVANKIIVSEIDSGKITSQDITSQGGTLKLGDIELEPGVVEELLKKLQESSRQPSILEEETQDAMDVDVEQKKTPIDFRVLEPSISQDSAATLGLSEENGENPAEPPVRPPRNVDKKPDMWEPDVDDEPPPRPPQPQVAYVPSQPPASFYALRAHRYVDDDDGVAPPIPRKKRHQRPKNVCTSSESGDVATTPSRRRIRTPEPSIPALTCQLVGACSLVFRNTIKRLIDQINVKLADQEAELGASGTNRHNVQVIIVILLVLIAGLLLLGYGDGRTVHLHHWEYFNPPKDI